MAYCRKYASDLLGLALIDTKAEADTAQGKDGRQKMIELVRSKGSAAVAEQMMPKMLAAASIESQAQVRQKLEQMMSDCPPLTIEHALAAMRDRDDYASHIPSIAVPVLVMVGESDAITPTAGAKAMSEAARRSSYVEVAAAGHMSPMEQPRAVSEALRRFVTEQVHVAPAES